MNTVIHVYNLPLHLPKKYLYTYFSRFGVIKKLRLNHINALYPSRDAVIQFNTKEAAIKSLVTNSTMVQGKKIKVRLMKTPQSVFSPTLYSDVYLQW